MEEYKKYLELYEKFTSEVVRIGKILQSDNYYIELYDCDENSITYNYEGNWSSADKDFDSFPPSLFFKSEEEIKAWDNERKEEERLKREEEIRKKAQATRELKEKHERAEFERLKIKYGQ